MFLWEKVYISSSLVRFFFGVLFVYGGAFFYPQTLMAAPTCTQTATDTSEIQTLIDGASSGDVICVPVGTHQVNLTLKDGVIIHGLELVRTFIESAADDATPVITGAGGSIVQNLTIQGAEVGISSVNSLTSFTIRNVIISGTTTGISCDSSILTVSNAVLNGNATAITFQNVSNITLKNTIISNNTTDLVLDAGSAIFYDSNLVYNNQTEKYPPPLQEPSSVHDDPRFVDSANNDYHLKSGSPAIDAVTTGDTDIDGSAADIGAYGGANADVIPFPVSGLTTSAVGADTVTLDWDSNDAYNIASYNVYFDTDNSGAPYDGSASEGNSPVNATLPPQTLSTITLPSPVSLTAPTGLFTVPSNETILVSWNAVTGANGYEVSYDTTPGPPYTNTVDAKNTTSYQITGLTNDVVIYIAVNAYYQPTVYLAVAAVDNSASSNESALVNEVSAALLGSVTTGPFSSEVSDYPEATAFYPNLEDEDKCFIATAAYGSFLEPQVVLLRKFRNHFLLTNSPGKRFVALYYKYGPYAASFINEHDWLKPVAQISLYPVIGLAWFCLKIGPALMLFFCFFAFASIMILRRYWRTKKCV